MSVFASRDKLFASHFKKWEINRAASREAPAYGQLFGDSSIINEGIVDESNITLPKIVIS